MQIKSQMFYTQINLFCNSVLHKLLETPECSLLSKQEISSSPTCSQLFSSLLFPWRWCILGRTRADRFSKPEESIRCAMSWRAQRSLLSPEDCNGGGHINTAMLSVTHQRAWECSMRLCCQWAYQRLGISLGNVAVLSQSAYVFLKMTRNQCPHPLQTVGQLAHKVAK